MRGIVTQVYRFCRPLVVPVVLWMTIGLGMFLRIDRADLFPIYQNDDGLFYVWAGNSILNSIWHPTSLTIFEAGNEQLIWRSQFKNIYPTEQFGFRLADPWFDHPFLATLFIALPSRWLGFTDFSQIPHMLVRAPALLASLLTLIMTYILSSRVFLSRRVGLAATLCLALWPLAVFSSRQSYIENIMTPIWLVSLFLSWKSIKTNNRWIFLSLVGCNFFLSWSKIVGYTAFAVSSFWLFKKHRIKWGILMLLSGLISFILYAGYGSMVGGTFFWHSLFNQGGRGAYVTSFFKVLASPDVHGIIEDGWWFLGWFSLIFLAAKKQKDTAFIALNALFWMLALFILSGPENTSPWYRYPVYPLLAIASGWMLVDWWRTHNLAVTSILLMLSLTGYKMAGIEVQSYYLRLGIVLFFGIFTFSQVLVAKKWQPWLIRPLIVVWALVAFYGNVLAVQRYPEIHCRDGNCIQPTKIDVSQRK